MPSTNIIAIDPSTTCTGLCINGKVSCFAQREIALTKKEKLTRWFEIVSEVGTINVMDTPSGIKKMGFSESERYKLQKYDAITDAIMLHISKNEKQSTKNICLIEGYSYSSAAGHLIDLVTFSTLLRKKLLDLNYMLVVVPPSELKMSAAKLTYKPMDVGKRKPKLQWRNNEDISGGVFKKPEMYKAIIENSSLKDDWSILLHEYSKEVLSLKKIPTPIDDINDAYLLYQTYISNIINM